MMLSQYFNKLAGVPIWFCAVIIAACLLLKEFYPFSHFPMYSKNAPGAYCIYVVDGDGKVLFTMPEFGRQSSILKKKFNESIQEIKADGRVKRLSDLTGEQNQAVGVEILRWLLEERKRCKLPPLTGDVRLMRDDFVLKKGRPLKETYELAKIPASAGS